MGGGKKKRTLTQIMKSQSKERSRGRSGRRSSASTSKEGKAFRIIPPNPRDKGVMKEVQKMRVLTPYTVASRFNLRLSAAKDFLEELHRRGLITYVSGGRNIRIYKPSE